MPGGREDTFMRRSVIDWDYKGDMEGGVLNYRCEGFHCSGGGGGGGGGGGEGGGGEGKG